MALLDFLFPPKAEAAPMSMAPASTLPDPVAGSTLPNPLTLSMLNQAQKPISGGITVDAAKGTSTASAGNYFFNATLKQDKTYLDALNKLQDLQNQQQTTRQSSIQQLQQFQKAIADNTMNQGAGALIDLRPAAALVDTWTGSKLAPYASAPLNVNERIGAIQGLQDKISGQQEKSLQEAQDLQKFKLKIDLDREEAAQKNLIGMQQLGSSLYHTAENSLKIGQAKPIDTKQLNEFSANKNARELIDDFVSYVKADPSRQGILSKIESLDPTNSNLSAEAKLLASKWDLMIQKIGLSLEKGVLREGDWKKYQKIFGNIQSNPASAIARLKNIKYELARSYVNDYNTQTMAKRDTSGFASDAQNVKNEADLQARQQGVQDNMIDLGSAGSMQQQLGAPQIAPRAGVDLIKLRNQLQGR